MLQSWKFTAVVAALAVLISGYWAGRVAIQDHHSEDLFIYSSGSWFALHGQSPYDQAAMHARVDIVFPDDPNLKGNNGYFLAPQALFLFVPLALLPWWLCKLVWGSLMIALATATGWYLPKLADMILPNWFTSACIVAIVLNPLTQFVLIVGQTTILILALVVFGELLHRRGRKHLGCLLWALAFFKPHMALVLLPLAFALSGWRRAVEVLLWVGVLNLLAGLVFFGKPLFILDYLNTVQANHKTVEYNRVGVNKQITSWNRLLVASGGPTHELGMVATIAGYGAFVSMVWLRSWPTRVASASWFLACAGCAIPMCCQLLPYELPVFLLALPFAGELVLHPSRRRAALGATMMLLMAYAMLPGGDQSEYYRAIRVFEFWPTLLDVLEAHRSLGVALLGVLTVAAVPNPK